MRVEASLYFQHSDHLGSATLTTGASGNWVGEARYTPYGEMRRDYPRGAIPTDRRFTGQRWEQGLGLYDYRARFYDPTLGRFLQPDSLVPEPGNPQALNRYAYGKNNPLRYVDPSGHIANDPNELARADEILQILQNQYGVIIIKDWGWLGIGTFWDPGSWRLEELETVLQGVSDLADLMGGAEQFRNNLGGVQIVRRAMEYLGEADAHKIWLRSIGSGGFMVEWGGQWTVVHELAHAWDAAQNWELSKELERYTGGRTILGKYRYGGIPPKGADARFTRKEDFAESVTTFIYPATAQAFIQTVYSDKPRFHYDNYYMLPRAVFVAQIVDMAPQQLLFLQSNRWGR